MSNATDALARRVAEHMLAREGTGPHWGIVIEEAREGYARLSMVVRADMLNGHRTAHGGMIFALADTAFAYACNAYNEVTVATGFDVNIVASGKLGDRLTASATEAARTRRTGVYDVEVRDQTGRLLLFFRGRSMTRVGMAIVPALPCTRGA